MARAFWRGSIAFGLVQIPVELHVAEQSHELAFRQLDRHDFAPIGYERVNRRTGKKVAWKDVVHGFEWSKDAYVVLDDDEIESARVEATHTIDIVAFVDADAVDAIYFEKPYYVTPVKQAVKAYVLLREVLARGDQIAIAKIVMRTRQRLVALRPEGNALALVTLRYHHELRHIDGMGIPDKPLAKLGVTEAEMKMAQMLVRGMHAKWKPESYEDEYRDDLMKLIEKKAKAGKINTIEPATRKSRAPVQRVHEVDLMKMLKRSLGERGLPQPAHARRAHTAEASGTRHRSASRKSA